MSFLGLLLAVCCEDDLDARVLIAEVEGCLEGLNIGVVVLDDLSKYFLNYPYNKCYLLQSFHHFLLELLFLVDQPVVCLVV